MVHTIHQEVFLADSFSEPNSHNSVSLPDFTKRNILRKTEIGVHLWNISKILLYVCFFFFLSYFIFECQINQKTEINFSFINMFIIKSIIGKIYLLVIASKDIDGRVPRCLQSNRSAFFFSFFLAHSKKKNMIWNTN